MIRFYDETEQEIMDDLDGDTQDALEAVGYFHGEDYYNTVTEALTALEEGTIRQFTSEDDLTSFYDLSKRLDTTLELEEDLLYLLGCTSECLESLGRFVTADDIEHVIDVDYNMVIVNGKCYENTEA